MMSEMTNTPTLCIPPDPSVGMDGLAAELTAARDRIAELEAVLTYYGDQFCEGLCREYGPNFDEDTCSGCKARAALAKRAK